MVFAQRSNDLSMNLWGRKWSPHPIPAPSSDSMMYILNILTLLYVMNLPIKSDNIFEKKKIFFKHLSK